MDFWKMNGAGNDFVVFNNMEMGKTEEEMSAITKIVCERHNSIGADGTMWVDHSDVADYKMTYFNSDGSKGEMCGNGARCICRYGYENGLAGEHQVVETTAGIVTGDRIDQRMYKIRINDPSVIQLDKTAEIDGKIYEIPYVEVGNPGLPHIAVEIKGLREYPKDELFKLGRALRFYESLPKGANVNFFDIEGEDQIYEITYERGVEDFTYACGTGTTSMVLVNTLKGNVSGKGVKVEMPGGTLVIDIELAAADAERVDLTDAAGETADVERVAGMFLTGLTNIVAKGIVTDENL